MTTLDTMRSAVLAAAACLSLAPPSLAQDPERPGTRQVYRMRPAVHFFGEQSWREFRERHDREVEREKALIQQYNEQALRRPVRPFYNPPEPPSRPPVYSGPRHPPEIREFKDEFSALVRDYVSKHSQGGEGAFVIDDSATGRRYQLKLTDVHADRIRRLSPDEVSGDVDFETADGPKGAVDLDFFLAKSEAWAVEKVLIHSINGKPRYSYDPANRVVAVPRPAAAARVIPKPTAPAHLSAEVAFTEPSGSNALQAGASGRLEVKVSNAGPGPAYAVRLSLDPHDAAGVEIPAEVEVGDLPAGQSISKEVALSASEDAAAGKLRIRLAINEANGFDTEPAVVELPLRSYQPPKLEVAEISVGGSGIVMAGEPTQVTVRVRNAGKGAARGVAAALELGSKDLFMSGDASVGLGDIEPGRSKNAPFEFFANKRFKSGETLPVSLTLLEATRKRGLASYPLKLVLGRSAPSVTVLAMKGSPAPKDSSPEPQAEAESVDTPPAARTPLDAEAYAVVVGIEKYRDVPAADFAARDAGIVYAYLTQAMGFDPKNVVLLQNERATLTDMATYLGPWLKDRATAKSKVFVYFAGHGTLDPKSGLSYLIPYDGDPAYTDTKAFPLQRFYDALAQLPTGDVTVALDSCFSGSGGRSVIAKGTRPLVTSAAAAKLGDNVVLLAAAGGDQISTDDPDARHGLLTYFLLRGLRGEADADGNGRVTTSELFAYVKPAVEREARKRHVEQSPVLSPPVEKLGARAERVWLRRR
ncbi:MAG: caspase family protein [Elusimicrobia bacterium]|nr:caspase family protein [Elusimicrobiota bacterium]